LIQTNTPRLKVPTRPREAEVAEEALRTNPGQTEAEETEAIIQDNERSLKTADLQLPKGGRALEEEAEDTQTIFRDNERSIKKASSDSQLPKSGRILEEEEAEDTRTTFQDNERSIKTASSDPQPPRGGRIPPEEEEGEAPQRSSDNPGRRANRTDRTGRAEAGELREGTHPARTGGNRRRVEDTKRRGARSRDDNRGMEVEEEAGTTLPTLAHSMSREGEENGWERGEEKEGRRKRERDGGECAREGRRRERRRRRG
jgi:hypothetical protein